MKFITIKESHYASDLYILKSKLESEGIACQIKDELSTQVMNHIPTIAAQLQVAEKDLEKTIEILNETGQSESEKSKLVCPKCGSNDLKVKTSIKTVFKSLGLLISAAFLLKPVGNIFKDAQYICNTCQQRFKISDSN